MLKDIVVDFVALQVIHEAADQVAFSKQEIDLELGLQAAHGSEVDVVPDFDFGGHLDGKVVLRLQDFFSFKILHVLVVQVHYCGCVVPPRFYFIRLTDLVYHFFKAHQLSSTFEPIAAQIEAQFQAFS